jgi:hypothetical protein
MRSKSTTIGQNERRRHARSWTHLLCGALTGTGDRINAKVLWFEISNRWTRGSFKSLIVGERWVDQYPSGGGLSNKYTSGNDDGEGEEKDEQRWMVSLLLSLAGPCSCCSYPRREFNLFVNPSFDASCSILPWFHGTSGTSRACMA